MISPCKSLSFQSLICVIVLSWSSTFPCNGFQLGSKSPFAALTTSDAVSASLQAANNDNSGGSKTETLNLVGKVRCTSPKAVPMVKDIKTFQDFVGKKESRNLLTTAGGERVADDIELTPELIQVWQTISGDTTIAQQIKDDDPTASSKYSGLAVATGGVNFVGLKVQSKGRFGAKLTLPQENDQKKKNEEVTLYEMTGLGDERTVSGW